MIENSILVVENLTKAKSSVFFVIVSYQEEEIYFKVKREMEKIFSEMSYESNPMPKWILPGSQKGMVGNNTKILSFKRRINREELPEVKKKCVQICKKNYKSDGTLRIIPGYLSAHNVIIASASDDFHKVYLFHGVFAEIIYEYQGGRYICRDSSPLFFTSNEVMYFYKNLRESFLYESK